MWASSARGSRASGSPVMAGPEELTAFDTEGILESQVREEIARRSVANRGKPARGILAGVLLGSACWAAALLFLLKHL